jgi:hypothetical protein
LGIRFYDTNSPNGQRLIITNGTLASTEQFYTRAAYTKTGGTPLTLTDDPTAGCWMNLTYQPTLTLVKTNINMPFSQQTSTYEFLDSGENAANEGTYIAAVTCNSTNYAPQSGSASLIYNQTLYAAQGTMDFSTSLMKITRGMYNEIVSTTTNPTLYQGDEVWLVAYANQKGTAAQISGIQCTAYLSGPLGSTRINFTIGIWLISTKMSSKCKSP